MKPSPPTYAVLIVAIGTFVAGRTGWADDVSGGEPQAVQVFSAPAQGATPQAMPGGPGVPPGMKPGGGPPGTAAGSPAGGKPGESKGDSATPEGGDDKVIRRGAIVIEKGDRTELEKAALGEDGRVAFEFRNQGWPELIEWLSDLSQQPFDWLELPADRVNITTPTRYTATEVIDLFNRHLLSRGYTMLALDGGMTVVKCSAINPAIVPRVSPEQLASVPPHSFVRTSLDVGWLSAEKLAEELKAMISENGKLTALTTTNRIEAMDAAITLKQIAELLQHEQDSTSRESLAPEFKLRHIPAAEAKRLLEQFLGVTNKPAPPMSPEQMQQMQMQMQMRMQQGGKQPAPEPPKQDISVVANTRQNSILIKAPPDRVAIATEFLKRIDVPGATMSSLADVQSRVEVFRLVSLDPEKLIEIVQEMNVLEPTTNIRVDTENRALIVSGSAADRFIIQQMITRLDGSGRKFEVLQLRRLEANDVAESIAFLMGMDEKKEENSRQRYPYFFGGGEANKKKEDKFRVAANTRFRQVLLWANESEMNEVRNLLVKLGELPPPTGNDRNIRVINADINPETFRYLKGLERQWQQIAPNPLVLPAEERFETKSNEPKSNETESAPATQSKELELPLKSETRPDEDDTVLMQSDQTRLTATFAQNEGDAAATQSPTGEAGQLDSAAEPPETKDIRSLDDFEREFMPSNQKPLAKGDNIQGAEPGAGEPGAAKQAEPIRIEIDAAGNLVISSRDTAALDRLEDVMLQFSPPKRVYHTFTTRYASATWVKLNLEEFFEDEDDKKDDSNRFPRWIFGFDDEEDNKKGPSGLGRSAKLKFLADIDTGTIVVSNASAEQLKTIEELIRLWDVPEPVNNRRVRYTRLVTLKFGRAGRVAETIKETYRDLLSSNDKAFQQAGQGGQGGGGGNQVPKANAANARSGGSELVDMGGSGQQGGGADFSFKGKLSLGIDELGNTLLVSAEGEQLLKLVCDMIDQLDQAARTSDGVRVVNLPASINASSLEMALRTLQSGTSQAAPAASNVPQPSPQRGSPAARPSTNRSPAPAAVESPDG